jgi:histidyl-tRNA synthetase
VIDPHLLTPISGFPEWTPGLRLAEQSLIDAIRSRYELFGFAPIETPAVERMSVLTAKGGIQRQIFTVGRPKEDEAEDSSLGLHFDLTVPLARYVAQHAEQLTFPFRRYQIQKVWRGERAQRGRFREFYQCDIDIVGSGTLDLVHDAEIPAVINATFDALGVPDFEIRISNRKILGSLFARWSISQDQLATGLRTIDKAGRDGAVTVPERLSGEGFPTGLIDAVKELLTAESTAAARSVLAAAGAVADGIDELDVVLDNATQLGVPAARLNVDFSIARGLDYYTGTVYETFIAGQEAWGSVCSGGRYDDLASFFSTRRYPGVGVSVGMTRLLDLLVQGRYISTDLQTPAKVVVTMPDRDRYLKDYLAIARTLRAAGIATEAYLERDALRDQIAYASAKNIPIAIIAGARELENDTVTVRDLRHHLQEVVTGDQLVTYVEHLLASR